MIDKPMCESCGEAEVEVRSAYAGLCSDCYGQNVSQLIIDAIGDRICGHPIFHDGKLVAICFEPHSSEHSHGTYRK